MGGPHPAVAAARVAVRDALAGLPAGSLVLVACSGGPDSVALAAATAFVAPRRGLRAGAVVVDHHLQPRSGVVARAAVDTCRGLGLDPALLVDVDVRGPGGVEAAARAARYTALEEAAREAGAVAVLLGHTLDDQAETVLLGLARGSGARSLAGMPAARGLLRRPFLGLRRVQTAAACTALGLPTWLDPTNADLTRRRAAVRARVLPELEAALGPGAVPALARTADLLRADADLLDALAADLLDRARVDPEPGPTTALDVATLDVATLAGAPLALRRRALLEAARAAGCPPGDLGADHVEALDRLVRDYHGQGAAHLPGGTIGIRRYGRLILRQRPADGPAGSTGR